MEFEQHSIETAPDAVTEELKAAEAAYGTVPNLYRGLANNPASLKIYLSMSETLQQHGALTPIEQQVVYMTTSAENGCTYCVAAHSALATMAEIPEQTLSELRQQAALSDPKLNALRNFTLAEMEHRGWVPDNVINDFVEAGYDQSHVLEVITIIAQKTLSNYFNHIAQTPLDDMFKPMAWEPAA